MPPFGLFKPPDVAKYVAEGDIRGLVKAARYRHEWTLRRDAVQALRDLGAARAPEPDPRIVSALILSLRDGHWKIREIAANSLGEIGAVQAIPSLLPTTADEVIGVRWSAVRALAHLLNLDPKSEPPSEAVAALIRAVRDQAWWVRVASAQALQSVADRVRDPRIVGWAANWLHMALEMDDYRIVRQAALDAMIALGAPPTISSLITALRDEAWSVRRSAADALESLGWAPPEEHLLYYWIAKGDCQRCVAMGQTAVEPLIGLLRDQYLPIQAEAVGALASLGVVAVPALLRAMQHRDHWTRTAAVEALGMIATQHARNGDTLPPLLAALDDPSKGVRRAAAHALGAIGDVEALERLLLLLNDHQATVREAAAKALGELGDHTAAQALMYLGRRDPDREVRRAAREALAAL